MGFWSGIIETWEEVSEEVEYPKLSRGSVLRVELKTAKVLKFDHFGIYAGNKEVIHFSEKKVRKEPLSQFVKGTSILNGSYVDVMAFSADIADSTSLEQSYRRAKSCLGMVGYDLTKANCEHFALWCRVGDAFSGQAFGSRSTLFPAQGSLNLPRLMGKAFNELGMEKSRSICSKRIVDV
ncbi:MULTISPECIES: lecithin retinol acyltransferase family protein [unclassified Psychrobacter]|uniref:lecithin retinol acyltransferase family protein n=1 Tax=unclassified Psychrobacter TaxID=196806 RepID=UPI0025B3ED15|nr:MULTISPECIES: lecithin retinol acyltransferase family protein [unclassified Psychrobacter]MDN3454597.1 lecithin retinol acyltransferase family protein [Psychrobacter sp. APC 3350]MDN3503647.1 lecithin retinol acyltransferase family protein [Psychrobacter sp. 5A.1]